MTDKYIEKLDKELEELIVKINGLPVGSKERADEIKNLETLSAIRSDIYQKQSENFATVSKVEQDDKKLEQEDLKIANDKKQSKVTIILNSIMIGVSAIGSIGTPLWIMTAERRGQFWSNRALNATEKPAKLNFLKMPFRK